MVDILVISPPSFVDVNRAVYRELAREGWSLEIVIPEQAAYANGLRSPDARAADDPPLHYRRWTSGNFRLRTFHGLVGLIEKRRPRIIYIDGDPASLLTVHAGLWSRGRGVAVVCQTCDNLSRTLKASFDRSGIRGLLSAAVIRALAFAAGPNVTHVFSINNDGIRVFSELGFRDRVSRIPLGFDPSLFHQNQEMRDRMREQLGLRHITVAFFGMLRRAKGVHLLIDALEGLMDYKWQFLLDRFDAYRDPYAEFIGGLLSHSPVGGRVLFFDATHKQMPRYMNAADIVVLPSISTPTIKEQYGRAVSEAMACGRMVIVSENGALPELVAEAGLVVPESDVSSLREALRRAIEDPRLREEYGRKALERAHEKLSIVQQAAIMDETFKMILNKN